LFCHFFLIFFVMFLSLLVAFLSSSSCPITINPPKVVVKHGDSVSINCTAHAEHNGMGWEVSQNGTGILETSNQFLTQWYFLCSAIPEKVQIVSNSSGGVMQEGEDYYLICEVHNIAPVENLTVMWYKDNIRFHPDKFNKSIDTLPNASKIYFSPTREHNGVQFRCEAHLDLTPEGPYINVSSQPFQIDVQFGPDVDCSTIEIAEGETLDSKCPALGNPAPYVKWHKNEQEINSSVALRPGNYRDITRTPGQSISILTVKGQFYHRIYESTGSKTKNLIVTI
uniref:Ig-like domain-containing protein n=1 Tax=Neogobius melanostomus TaxID=47308 RepID=A0A8C6UCD2_9GOBI